MSDQILYVEMTNANCESEADPFLRSVPITCRYMLCVGSVGEALSEYSSFVLIKILYTSLD